MKFHPASNEFPLLEGEELGKIVTSMREQGFLPEFKIVIYQNQILDGRNRFNAAKIAGVEPLFTEYEGNAPYSFVVAANNHRRHMAMMARIKLAERLLPKLREEAAQRKQNLPSPERANLPLQQKQGKNDDFPPDTRKHVSRILGVSERTADAAIKVLEHGTPEVIDAMKNEEISFHDAASTVGLPQQKLAKAVQAVKEGKAGTVREAVGKTTSKPRSINGKPIADHGKAVTEAFGRLMVAIDGQARYFGCLNKHGKVVDTPAHLAIRSAMREWKSWAAECEQEKGE